jgi:hypothetical protein
MWKPSAIIYPYVTKPTEKPKVANLQAYICAYCTRPSLLIRRVGTKGWTPLSFVIGLFCLVLYHFESNILYHFRDDATL